MFYVENIYRENIIVIIVTVISMEMINIILGLTNILIGLIMILLVYPLKKGLIKMNWWYGFRFSVSFKSDENWYNINKYGAKRFMFWAIPLLIIGLIAFVIPFNENFLLILLFSFLPLIVLIPAFESYLFAKNLE